MLLQFCKIVIFGLKPTQRAVIYLVATCFLSMFCDYSTTSKSYFAHQNNVLNIYFVKLTSKIEYENISIPKEFWKNNKPFVLAFWHSQLMMISFSWIQKSEINKYIIKMPLKCGRFVEYFWDFNSSKSPGDK